MSNKIAEHRRKGFEDAELVGHSLPQRPGLENSYERLIEIYGKFVKAHPEKANALLERCKALTEQFRPLSTERNLNAKQAEKFTGFTRGMVTRLARMGIAGESRNGCWFFSEVELRNYLETRRKPGRPKNKIQ